MTTIMQNDKVIENDTVEPGRSYPRDNVTMNADTARQGPQGRRVLYVLIGGLAGAVILCFALYAIWTTLH